MKDEASKVSMTTAKFNSLKKHVLGVCVGGADDDDSTERTISSPISDFMASSVNKTHCLGTVKIRLLAAIDVDE